MPPPDEAWSVYVLRCGDGTLYTGIARDVQARVSQHESGKGARYTRGRGPFELLGKVRCRGKGEALRLELALKGLPRARKLALVARPRRLAAFARTLRPRGRPSLESKRK